MRILKIFLKIVSIILVIVGLICFRGYEIALIISPISKGFATLNHSGRNRLGLIMGIISSVFFIMTFYPFLYWQLKQKISFVKSFLLFVLFIPSFVFILNLYYGNFLKNEFNGVFDQENNCPVFSTNGILYSVKSFLPETYSDHVNQYNDICAMVRFARNIIIKDTTSLNLTFVREKISKGLNGRSGYLNSALIPIAIEVLIILNWKVEKIKLEKDKNQRFKILLDASVALIESSVFYLKLFDVTWKGDDSFSLLKMYENSISKKILNVIGSKINVLIEKTHKSILSYYQKLVDKNPSEENEYLEKVNNLQKEWQLIIANFQKRY